MDKVILWSIRVQHVLYSYRPQIFFSISSSFGGKSDKLPTGIMNFSGATTLTGCNASSLV